MPYSVTINHIKCGGELRKIGSFVSSIVLSNKYDTQIKTFEWDEIVYLCSVCELIIDTQQWQRIEYNFEYKQNEPSTINTARPTVTLS